MDTSPKAQYDKFKNFIWICYGKVWFKLWILLRAVVFANAFFATQIHFAPATTQIFSKFTRKDKQSTQKLTLFIKNLEFNPQQTRISFRPKTYISSPSFRHSS